MSNGEKGLVDGSRMKESRELMGETGGKSSSTISSCIGNERLICECANRTLCLHVPLELSCSVTFLLTIHNRGFILIMEYVTVDVRKYK